MSAPLTLISLFQLTRFLLWWCRRCRRRRRARRGDYQEDEHGRCDDERSGGGHPEAFHHRPAAKALAQFPADHYLVRSLLLALLIVCALCPSLSSYLLSPATLQRVARDGGGGDSCGAADDIRIRLPPAAKNDQKRIRLVWAPSVLPGRRLALYIQPDLLNWIECLRRFLSPDLQPPEKTTECSIRTGRIGLLSSILACAATPSSGYPIFL